MLSWTWTLSFKISLIFRVDGVPFSRVALISLNCNRTFLFYMERDLEHIYHLLEQLNNSTFEPCLFLLAWWHHLQHLFVHHHSQPTFKLNQYILSVVRVTFKRNVATTQRKPVKIFSKKSHCQQPQLIWKMISARKKCFSDFNSFQNISNLSFISYMQ